LANRDFSVSMIDML